MRAWQTGREARSFVGDVLLAGKLLLSLAGLYFSVAFLVHTVASNHSGMALLKAFVRALPAKLWELAGF